MSGMVGWMGGWDRRMDGWMVGGVGGIVDEDTLGVC